MALVCGVAGIIDGRLRESAVGPGVVELDEQPVVVFLDHRVEGREVDIDSVSANRLEPGGRRRLEEGEDFGFELAAPVKSRDPSPELTS